MTRPKRWSASRVAVVAGLLLVAIAFIGSCSSGDGPPSSTTTTTGPNAATTTRSGGTSDDSVATTEPAVDPVVTTAAPGETTVTTSSPPGAAAAASARAALRGLVVRAGEARLAPYRRAAFTDGWDYDPATGCNIRERVLIDEAVTAPTLDDRCHPITGRWISSYDGVVTTDPADLQIDHLVPLADAWRSGADQWTDERRHAFANDLTSPDTLIAVTGRTNESKSDSSPDDWLPPDRSAWCGYGESWVRVKARWALTVTSAEAAALGRVLAAC